MANWTFSTSAGAQKNYLSWFKPGTGVRIADLTAPVAATAVAEATAVCASFQPQGARLYCGMMDANGIGVSTGKVYDYAAGAADPLFAAPIATTPTFADLGGSFTTPGAKLWGYLIQTRTGFITKPCPAPSDQFTGVAYTSAGGAITMTIDPPGHVWPDYALNVAAIMTTSANLAQFYIVPSWYAGGSPWTPVNRSGATVILIEVTDEVLINSTDANQYFDQLSMTIAGVSPVKPAVITSYGQRMAYIALDSSGVPTAWFSKPGLPQNVSAAQGFVNLPGLRQIVTACQIQQTFFLFGKSYTYSTSDSNLTPVEWMQPQLVDGTIGAAGPFCVSLSSNQQYAWVAGESGLYRLDGGAYPDRPTSYWQKKDWQRINFDAATKIQVVDHKGSQLVEVMAPLDGATTPTHVLTFDYSIGPGPDEIQYSLKSIADYSLGSVSLVQNPTNKTVEVWYGPSDAANSIIRENDGSETNVYRDVDAAITSIYETALLPPGAQGRLIMHHADRWRIVGYGTASYRLWSMDHSYSFPVSSPVEQPPLELPLDENPGREILQRYFLLNEMMSCRITTDELDEWFRVSNLAHYYTFAMPQR